MGIKDFVLGKLAGLAFLVAFLLIFLAVTGAILPDKLVELKKEIKEFVNVPQQNSDDFDKMLDSQFGTIGEQIGLNQMKNIVFPAIIILIAIASFLLYLKNRNIALTFTDIFRSFRNNSIMYVVSMAVLWLIIPIIFGAIFPNFFSDISQTSENKAMVAKFQIIITDWTKSLLVTLMIVFAVIGVASWVLMRLAENRAKEKEMPEYLKREEKKDEKKKVEGKNQEEIEEMNKSEGTNEKLE
ncbi:MAG: hypothetical protein ABII22_02220 [Candidatus Micrarchaeota archaeon]